MYIYIYIYICIYIYVCVSIYIYIHIHICTTPRRPNKYTQVAETAVLLGTLNDLLEARGASPSAPPLQLTEALDLLR